MPSTDPLDVEYKHGYVATRPGPAPVMDKPVSASQREIDELLKQTESEAVDGE